MRTSFTATVLMLLTALLCLSGSAYAQKKSKKKASAQAKSGVMPAWEKGYLDIHFISTVFKLSYGDFDYYGGGDVTHNGRKYYAWKDIETPIANVVGEVEVMKSDHHGSSDSNHDYFVRTLSPQAVILTVWRNVQPKGGLQKYLNDNVNGGMTDLFSTSLDMGLEEKLGSGAARILSKEGHLVVRVNPGGESYYIYSLSDKDESMNINERFGPYKSR